jgi:hypothetical protein
MVNEMHASDAAVQNLLFPENASRSPGSFAFGQKLVNGLQKKFAFFVIFACGDGVDVRFAHMPSSLRPVR